MRKIVLSLLAGAASLAFAGIAVPEPADAGYRNGRTCGVRVVHRKRVRTCATERVIRRCAAPPCEAVAKRLDEPAYPAERPAPLPKAGHATLGESGRCWMNPQGPMAGVRGWEWSDGRCHLARP